MNRITRKIVHKHLRNDGLDDARLMFLTQKNSARQRGINWELTFEQWIDWWGEDLPLRGCLANQLSMQRRQDRGPYALDNIYKGTPLDNAMVREVARPIKKADLVAMRIKRRLDEEMLSPTVGKRIDEVESEDETWFRENLGFASSLHRHDLPVWG